jgi:hypothetical protein
MKQYFGDLKLSQFREIDGLLPEFLLTLGSEGVQYRNPAGGADGERIPL